MEAGGSDSDGREFKDAAEMWREQVGEDAADSHKKVDWYRNGVGYWQVVEASMDGVLGGYGHINDADIKGSEAFLKSILSEIYMDGGVNRHLVALDCGAGIGRVTKNLLVRYFNEIDLLEPVSHFLEAARESLAPASPTGTGKNGATNFYCLPLQEFTPEKGRYDVIWIQWCIGHLTDDDLVSFFRRAKCSRLHVVLMKMENERLAGERWKRYSGGGIMRGRGGNGDAEAADRGGGAGDGEAMGNDDVFKREKVHIPSEDE
ncbi:hypothetical protein Dimus_031562 [Dionaea muscipula]